MKPQSRLILKSWMLFLFCGSLASWGGSKISNSIKNSDYERREGEKKTETSIYNITDFGAVADGKTKNTEAIQKAIDACHLAGGGKVLCGAGCFLTGSLMLKSNVELRLIQGCRIVGSPCPDDYKDFVAPGFISRQLSKKNAIEYKSLFSAIEAENIAITGPGKIDGSGMAFYDVCNANAFGKLSKPSTPTPRPQMVMFYKCRHVRFEDTSFIDSPSWTIWLMKCREVKVHRVNISGNWRLRNNDGIDIDSCRNVIVSDSFFDTEDDCLTVYSIQHRYDRPDVCENVTVNNCVLNSQSQGIRVGIPGDASIRNCTFSNLVINSAHNGITTQHLKRYLPEGSRGSADIHDIMFSNVIINCVENPVVIDVEEGIELKKLANLSFSNFRIKSGGPCIVRGSRETIIRNVSFSNIEIETSGENAVICRNCEGIKLTDVNLSNRLESFPDLNALNYMSNEVAEYAKIIEMKKIEKVSAEQCLFVDLSSYANRGFKDEIEGDEKGGWVDQGAAKDFRNFSVGRKEFLGVPFNIIDPEKNDGKSCIVLKGRERLYFPDQITDIKVKTRVNYIYFLHTCAWTSGKQIQAEYVINYSDGARETIEVREGENIADWCSGANLPLAKVAWIGRTPGGDGVCAFLFKWHNPHSEKDVGSVDFISKGKGVPVLLGITCLKRDAPDDEN